MTTWRKGALSLGSNIGDKVGHIRAAIDALDSEETIRVLDTSRFFQTAPWGDLDQDWFLNACVTIETGLEPLDLLAVIKSHEEALGRQRTRRWGPRVIDIDILVLNDIELVSEVLSIPHRQLIHRAFVLVPLHDIWPDLSVMGQPISEHLRNITREEGDVVPYNP
ncbi:MAG: 2-amino-4-hydroxy-6-hydroxymethyldihydropteridine diphosphokinase [Pseudomonadota bacterium]